MEYLSDLELLQEQQIDEAAEIIAEAFLNSPCYAYIYQGTSEDERREALTWLFAKNLRIRLGNGAARCAFLCEPGKPRKMVCFFMLEMPGAGDVSAWTMLSNGILWLPVLYGLGTFRRLLEVKDYAEESDRKCLNSAKAGAWPASSFCQLERMVVHPSCQGKGVGSKFLAAALEEAAVVHGLGCVLSTQEEANVRFYTRLGFEVTERDDNYVGGTNWTMFKAPPVSKAASSPENK
mmetsp:Transcript_18163/g.37282  ORF Transcript_18163/g.37282 Transcript_18163/m.37282 type:complete len:235 (-) Transcript_18163:191-895(-)